MSWNICYKTHRPRNTTLRTLTLFPFLEYLQRYFHLLTSLVGLPKEKRFMALSTWCTQNKAVVPRTEKSGLVHVPSSRTAVISETRFVQEQITFEQAELSCLWLRTWTAHTRHWTRWTRSPRPVGTHTVTVSSEQCQGTPQGNTAHLLPFCTGAEVRWPWRQQGDVIWQIPVCASEKTAPVQTVIPWEPVVGTGNTENSNFPVKWGRMIHEIFKSHPLYYAISSTEVHGHLILLWPPLPSTSGLSISKSSSQITPGMNTFILVCIPVSCLGRAQLTNIYFLSTHLSFHCISRSLSLPFKITLVISPSDIENLISPYLSS